MPPHKKNSSKSKKRRPGVNKKLHDSVQDKDNNDTNDQTYSKISDILDLLDKLSSMSEQSEEYKSGIEDLKQHSMFLKKLSNSRKPEMVCIYKKYASIISEVLCKTDTDLISKSNCTISNQNNTLNETIKIKEQNIDFSSAQYEFAKDSTLKIYICNEHNILVGFTCEENPPELDCGKCKKTNTITEATQLNFMSTTSMIGLMIGSNLYTHILKSYTTEDVLQRIEENKKSLDASQLNVPESSTVQTQVQTDTIETLNAKKISETLQSYENKIKEKKPDVIIEMMYSIDYVHLCKSSEDTKKMCTLLIHMVNVKEEYNTQSKYALLCACAEIEKFIPLFDYFLYEINQLSSGDVTMKDITGENKKIMLIMTEVSATSQMISSVFDTIEDNTVHTCKQTMNKSSKKHNDVYKNLKIMSPQLSAALKVQITNTVTTLSYENIKIAQISTSKVCQDFKDVYTPKLKKSTTKSKTSTNSQVTHMDTCICGYTNRDTNFDDYIGITKSLEDNGLMNPLLFFNNICSTLYDYMTNKDGKYEYICFNKESLRILNNKFTNIHSYESYSNNILSSFISNNQTCCSDPSTRVFIFAKILPMLLHDFDQNDCVLIPILQILGSLINYILSSNNPYSYDDVFCLKAHIYFLEAYIEAIIKNEDISNHMHMLYHFVPEYVYFKEIYGPNMVVLNLLLKDKINIPKRFSMSLINHEPTPIDLAEKEIYDYCSPFFDIQDDIILFYDYLNKNNLLKKNIKKTLNISSGDKKNQDQNQITNYLLENVTCGIELECDSIKYVGFNPSGSDTIIDDIQDCDNSFMLYKGIFPQLLRAHYFIEYDSQFYVIARKYLDCKIGDYNSYFYVPKTNGIVKSERCVIPLKQIVLEHVLVADSCRGSKINEDKTSIDSTQSKQSNKKDNGSTSKAEARTYIPFSYIRHNGITDITINPFIHTRI